MARANAMVYTSICPAFAYYTVSMGHTVPKLIDFPRYNMKCSGENEKLCGIFHVVSRFPLYISCYFAEIMITFWKVHGPETRNTPLLLLQPRQHRFLCRDSIFLGTVCSPVNQIIELFYV